MLTCEEVFDDLSDAFASLEKFPWDSYNTTASSNPQKPLPQNPFPHRSKMHKLGYHVGIRKYNDYLQERQEPTNRTRMWAFLQREEVIHRRNSYLGDVIALGKLKSHTEAAKQDRDMRRCGRKRADLESYVYGLLLHLLRPQVCSQI